VPVIETASVYEQVRRSLRRRTGPLRWAGGEGNKRINQMANMALVE
jgi:hypothetical protein